MTDSAEVDTQSLVHEVELRVPEDDAGVASAREFTRQTLGSWAYRGRAEDVVLLVSELVSNALRHGHGAPVLRLVRTTHRIRVEVIDDSPLVPEVGSPGAHGGWGLRLVEKLTSDWGVTARKGGGKVVWAELPATAARGDDGSDVAFS